MLPPVISAFSGDPTGPYGKPTGLYGDPTSLRQYVGLKPHLLLAQLKKTKSNYFDWQCMEICIS